MAFSVDEAIVRAKSLAMLGDIDQAKQLYRTVLETFPNNKQAHDGLAELDIFLKQINALVVLYRQGRLEAVLEQGEALSKQYPQSFVLCDIMSTINARLRRWDAAKIFVTRMLQIKPDHAVTHYNLGIILKELGRHGEAIDCFIKAVQINPGYADAHNNLGNIFRELGRYDEAHQHYRKALELRPSQAEAHSNLADLLNVLGKTQEALAEARRAIALNPQYAEAYVNAAAITLTAGEPEEALRWLDRLATFAPDHPGGLLARARALLECDRPKEALEAARRAVTVTPESGEAANALGQVLAELDQSEEALAMFERAAMLPAPQPEDALINKGILLMQIDRNSEALAAYDEALAINHASARALFNRVGIRSNVTDDPDIARMESLLASGAVESNDNKIMLHFTLGKSWLDAGDGDRAFAHLAEGNRLKRKSIIYDPDAMERRFAQIAESFNPGLMARFADAGDAADVPVFVLGMPRSGTTLIEQILASHPDVHGAGELRTLNALVKHAAKTGLQDFPVMMASIHPQSLAALGRSYADHVRSLAPTKKLVVDKMPGNFHYAGLIHLILPNARIIHCRRDAADTGLSCYATLFAGGQEFTYDLTELGRYHRNYEALMAHWRALLPSSRFLEVQYEDVVDALEPQARRMIAFLGLEWDEACLAFHDTQRQIHTASLNQVRQPIYRSSIGRWKHYANHLRPLLDGLGVADE
jgi:tetratricopeptide (TPR) repeat protein